MMWLLFEFYLSTDIDNIIQAYFFSRLTTLYCLDTVSHFLADSVYGFIAAI